MTYQSQALKYSANAVQVLQNIIYIPVNDWLTARALF